MVITQQPSAPTQRCVIDGGVIIRDVNDIRITVSCAQFLYVTNAADSTLSSFVVNPATGALTRIGTPTATGAAPHAIVGLECGSTRFVVVASEGSNDISAFAVDNTTGGLTTVPGSPYPAGVDPQTLAVVGFGSSLWVANAGSDNILTYDICGNTGVLTAGPSVGAAGKNPTSFIWSFGYVFSANHGGSNDISKFETGPPPVLISSFPAGGSPLSLALAVPGGGVFLYSANPDATKPSISGFAIDPTTAALSPLSGSPFPLPVSHYIAIDLTGTNLYVTSGTNVVGYSIDATTGALAPLPGFPVAAGANAYSITIDPTNQFLYVVNEGAANISGFRLDASTGALIPMAGSPFPAGNHPQFIATF